LEQQQGLSVSKASSRWSLAIYQPRLIHGYAAMVFARNIVWLEKGMRLSVVGWN
jgi:hypothetical protein